MAAPIAVVPPGDPDRRGPHRPPSRITTRTTRPVVTIGFNAKGARAFAETTQQNVGKPFAIILDNQVLSAPNINEPILGGSAIINGNFTVQSAQALAISLQSGSLPIALKMVEERTVGPGLGADSIHAGVIASAIAVAAVVVFMFVTYGRFGVYANLAVIINVFVILGVMALLNATLTLPGIAGFVLTIGTAVDANVLINERIREERRRGRNVVQAVELGYKEASRTIFEANVTHAISGLIMLIARLGTGEGLRGGAADRHRHVGVHRRHLHAHAGRALDPPQPPAGHPYLRRTRPMRLLKIVPDNTNIGFVQLRGWAFGLTMLLTIAAVALVGVRGPQLRRRFRRRPDDRGQVRSHGAARRGARQDRRARRRRRAAPAVRRRRHRVDPPAAAQVDRRGRQQRVGRQGRGRAQGRLSRASPSTRCRPCRARSRAS